ncbi:MAG: hypothetical protein EP297_12735 [Gammaproteobacteria bacterium]|nr:MAG: hypothetical protein EP297_12735 [Gammaproteobacteria bacterium]
MMTGELNNTQAISPRFEFRSFGREFDLVVERMVQLSDPVPERVRERQSEEIYIMSKYNNTNNTKIRYGLMDIKTLIRTVDGLEQWGPLMKAEFPVDSSILADHIFPALQAQLPVLDQEDYSLEDFLVIISNNEILQAVNVNKHRFGYSVNGTICEMAMVEIDGNKVVTVATESTDIDAVKKTISYLGLAGMENINYLQAIKRVVGMSDKPLAN